MMRPGPAASIFLLSLMLATAGIAWALTPTIFLADQLAPLQLRSAVPAAFGDWRELPFEASQIVDPSSEQLINAIYTETLTRTYINSKGYRVMLSIAYGRDQRDSLQLHQPEACYPAQGFKLLNKQASELHLAGRTITGTRLDTQLGNRREPVTYWTMVGDKVFKDGLHKKLVEMQYGTKGYIPDGMLVRVSSIDENITHAYLLQEQFSADMVQSLPNLLAPRFAGLQKL
ncbi:EpsI family protein [Rhodoferax ferrireducens]|uniref:EpsI family protein n=1 Tax=Rhodoferax ferrireducens TaxID=192843 RepID=A0ABU2C6C7_9BURK|nr:exosortase-associated protein EpsI, B-type [Rhodoferax ferrireducens]MDR7376904.1 EpsI family protein [Rhodoferax ferrireducens]